MPRYTYIWAFRVRSDRLEEFSRYYGEDGVWVQLFRRALGFEGTKLLQDRSDPARFLTIDTWESIEKYRAFRDRFAAEYAALDLECGGLTVSEVSLGEYSYDSPDSRCSGP